MVQKFFSTWSIIYNSCHTAKFALLHLKLCKETLPKNLLGLLGDNDEEIRRLAVNKIQALQDKALEHTIPNSNFQTRLHQGLSKRRRCS